MLRPRVKGTARCRSGGRNTGGISLANALGLVASSAKTCSLPACGSESYSSRRPVRPNDALERTEQIRCHHPVIDSASLNADVKRTNARRRPAKNSPRERRASHQIRRLRPLITVERCGEEWVTFDISGGGKRRRADGIVMPGTIADDALDAGLDDLCHESATGAHPNVRRL